MKRESFMGVFCAILRRARVNFPSLFEGNAYIIEFYFDHRKFSYLLLFFYAFVLYFYPDFYIFIYFYMRFEYVK